MAAIAESNGSSVAAHQGLTLQRPRRGTTCCRVIWLRDPGVAPLVSRAAQNIAVPAVWRGIDRGRDAFQLTCPTGHRVGNTQVTRSN